MDQLVQRNAQDLGTELLAAFPALIIQGARQAGKSTLAAQLTTGRTAVAVTLDQPGVLAAARSESEDFVAQAAGATLVIDELQRAPELILPIKAAVDNDRRPGQFVLTGSSDLLALHRNPDSLAGRTVTLRLSTFSQGEIVGRVDDFAARARERIDGWATTSQWSRADYVRAIVRGGYPAIREKSARMRGVWFDSYVDAIVSRDIADISPRTQSAGVSAVLRLLAAGQAGEFVRSRVARDADLPESTVTSYLRLLETTYLVQRIPAWTPNLTSREARRPKILITDSGLAMRLAGLTEEQLVSLDRGAVLGPMLEGFVVAELLKQRSWSDQEYRLYHFRDRAGLEVDAVLEFNDGTVVGIEVKAGSTAKSDQFAGLRMLRDRLGDRFVGGFVLNTASRGMRFSDRLWTLPISALWES